MGKNESIATINERVELAIAQLREIRKLARKGGPIDPDNFSELRQTIDSLRHHAEMLSLPDPVNP